MLPDQLGLRVSLGAAAMLAAAVLTVALGYRGTILRCGLVSAVGCLLTAVWCVFADVLHARREYRSYATVTLLAGIAVTAATVAAAGLGGGPVALAGAYLVNPLVLATVLGWRVRRAGLPIRLAWRPARFRELLRESRALAALDIATVVRGQFDQVVAPKLMGPMGYGFYQAGSLPSSRLVVVPDSLSTASYALIARAHAQGGDAAAERELGTLIRLTLALCCPAAIGIAALAPTIAGVLFPRLGSVTAQVIWITMLSFPLEGLNYALRHGLQATGRHVAAARAGLVGVVLGGILTVGLIAWIGVLGAALASVLRPVVTAQTAARPARGAFPQALRLAPYRAIVVAALIMILAIVGLRLALPGGPVTAVIGAATGGVAYLLALAAMGEISRTRIAALIGEFRQSTPAAPEAT
jgi:putative peptidoglycan lipid II flippase